MVVIQDVVSTFTARTVWFVKAVRFFSLEKWEELLSQFWFFPVFTRHLGQFFVFADFCRICRCPAYKISKKSAKNKELLPVSLIWTIFATLRAILRFLLIFAEFLDGQPARRSYRGFWLRLSFQNEAMVDFETLDTQFARTSVASVTQNHANAPSVAESVTLKPRKPWSVAEIVTQNHAMR